MFRIDVNIPEFLVEEGNISLNKLMERTNNGECPRCGHKTQRKQGFDGKLFLCPECMNMLWLLTHGAFAEDVAAAVKMKLRGVEVINPGETPSQKEWIYPILLKKFVAVENKHVSKKIGVPPMTKSEIENATANGVCPIDGQETKHWSMKKQTQGLKLCQTCWRRYKEVSQMAKTMINFLVDKYKTGKLTGVFM